MAVVLEQEKIETIDTGIYRARVNNIESDEGQFGAQVKFEFEITDNPWAGKSLTGWCSAKFNIRTKLFRWTRAILGRRIPEDERFNSAKLVGRECRLSIVVKVREDGTEYNKIDEVLEAKSEPASSNGRDSSAEPTDWDDIAPLDELEREQFTQNETSQAPNGEPETLEGWLRAYEVLAQDAAKYGISAPAVPQGADVAAVRVLGHDLKQQWLTVKREQAQQN